ncbi:MAG TPA: major capsid protein [Burkholderiaceae bacterium]|jgi:hypothetical protein
MNKILARVATLTPAAALASLALMGTAHAAIPADVSTALTSLNTDALEVAGIVLAAIVGVFAFKFIRKGL